MKPTIYCKAPAKGIQTFYVNVDGKEYYLFSQSYRISVKAVFHNPVQIDKIFNYSSTHKDSAVRHTLEKLPAYIKYVEREYGIEILRKTAKSNKMRRNYRNSNSVSRYEQTRYHNIVFDY